MKRMRDIVSIKLRRLVTSEGNIRLNGARLPSGADQAESCGVTERCTQLIKATPRQLRFRAPAFRDKRCTKLRRILLIES
jgi:hypothetical protein